MTICRTMWINIFSHIQTISDQYFRCICFQASSILFHFICHTQLLIQSKLILSDLCAQQGKPHGNHHCCAQAFNKVKILAYYIMDVVFLIHVTWQSLLSYIEPGWFSSIVGFLSSLGNLQVRVYSLQPIADFLSLPRKTLIFASVMA